HFFRDHAELEMARPGAAELLRDRDAEKSHLGKPLPQFLVVGRLAVEHQPHRLRRAFFGKVFSRLIAQLLLVVGEIEVHGGLPPTVRHSGAREARTMMCNCTSENLDVANLWIPGSALRAAPE